MGSARMMLFHRLACSLPGGYFDFLYPVKRGRFLPAATTWSGCWWLSVGEQRQTTTASASERLTSSPHVRFRLSASLAASIISAPEGGSGDVLVFVNTLVHHIIAERVNPPRFALVYLIHLHPKGWSLLRKLDNLYRLSGQPVLFGVLAKKLF